MLTIGGAIRRFAPLVRRAIARCGILLSPKHDVVIYDHKRNGCSDYIERLPDDTTWDEIRERNEFIAGVRKGLAELDEGKGIPHTRVREEFAQWLTR